MDAWFARWNERLIYVSPDLGCGCCVHMFNVEGPREAMDELPPVLLASSDYADR